MKCIMSVGKYAAEQLQLLTITTKINEAIVLSDQK